MMKVLNNIWWLILIRGIIFLILAFVIFKHPINAILGLSIYISISLLFTGITQIITAFGSKDTHKNWYWILAVGVIDIVFAFVLLSNPVITAATLPFVVGFWVIVYGVMTFVNAFQDKKDGVPNWWLSIIGGLVAIFIGFVLTNNLLAGALVITSWLGIGFLLAGIVNIGVAIGAKSLKNALKNNE